MDNSAPAEDEKKQELYLFLFLTILLAPLVTAILIGSYGFLIWISQMLSGPPTQ